MVFLTKTVSKNINYNRELMNPVFAAIRLFEQLTTTRVKYLELVAPDHKFGELQQAGLICCIRVKHALYDPAIVYFNRILNEDYTVYFNIDNLIIVRLIDKKTNCIFCGKPYK